MATDIAFSSGGRRLFAQFKDSFPFLASGAGLGVSMTIVYFQWYKLPVNCSFGVSCNQTIHGEHSRFLGVPISIFGMVAFLVLAFFSSPRMRAVRMYGVGSFLTFAFALSSWSLVAYGILVLKSLCNLCVATSICFTLVLLTSPISGPKSGTHPSNRQSLLISTIFFLSIAIAVFGFTYNAFRFDTAHSELSPRALKNQIQAMLNCEGI